MYTDNTWVLNGQKQKKKKIIVAIEGLTWIDVCTSLWKLTCSTHPTDYFKLLSFVSPEMFVKPLCCSVGFIEVSPTHTVNRSLFVCVFFFNFSLVKQIKSVEWCSSMKKTHYPPPLWQIKIILVERFLGVLMSVQIPCCL